MTDFRQRLISAAAAVLLSAFPVVASGEIMTGDFAQAIEAAAAEEIAASGTPSLQISVGLGSEIVYENAFGLADIENSVKATTKSKYRTASIAKWFTATAAMRLAENGTLDLDKPVQVYCPKFPEKKHVVTTRQLLTHTSGVRHYLDYEEALKAAGSPQQRAEIEKKMLRENLSSFTRHTDVFTPLETFKDDELLFEPGSSWAYSSFGYRLLACVLQGASDTPYVDLMESTVFGPASMADTRPDDAWALIDHRATGYRISDGDVRRADLRDVSENLPAGGYLSTASDLVRFAIAFDTGLVSEAARNLMSTPVATQLDSESEPSWRDAIPQGDKYGYGLMLLSKYSDGMVGHTGRQAGGSAIVILVPDSDLSIAVMTNAKGWNGYINFAMRIKRIVESHLQNELAVNGGAPDVYQGLGYDEEKTQKLFRKLL